MAVYFIDDAGALVAEARPAPAGVAAAGGRDAALAERPGRRPRWSPPCPRARACSAPAVEGGVATVDLSRELESGYPSGGSAAELAVLGPLVKTAAEAAGDGAGEDPRRGARGGAAGLQLDLSEPLSPADVAAGG